MLWPGLFVMTMGENREAKRRNKKSSDLRCFFVAVRMRPCIWLFVALGAKWIIVSLVEYQCFNDLMFFYPNQRVSKM